MAAQEAASASASRSRALEMDKLVDNGRNCHMYLYNNDDRSARQSYAATVRGGIPGYFDNMHPWPLIFQHPS